MKIFSSKQLNETYAKYIVSVYLSTLLLQGNSVVEFHIVSFHDVRTHDVSISLRFLIEFTIVILFTKIEDKFPKLDLR